MQGVHEGHLWKADVICGKIENRRYPLEYSEASLLTLMVIHDVAPKCNDVVTHTNWVNGVGHGSDQLSEIL